MPTSERALVEEAHEGRAVPAELSSMHDLLEHFWGRLAQAVPDPPEPSWRMHFTIAVAEIGANIVRHAYPAGEEPGPLRLSLAAYPDRVEALFVDRGRPYVQGSWETRVLPESIDELPESGYGMALARQVVDDLHYDRTPEGINRWWLVKRL